jgi:hypothetical protein
MDRGHAGESGDECLRFAEIADHRFDAGRQRLGALLTAD